MLPLNSQLLTLFCSLCWPGLYNCQMLMYYKQHKVPAVLYYS